MQVLSTLLGPAYFTDFSLIFLARVSHCERQHAARGERRVPRTAVGWLGTILGPVFPSFTARGIVSPSSHATLVDKRGFIAYQAKALPRDGTRPQSGHSQSTTAIDFSRAAFRIATGTGQLTYACLQHGPIRHRPSPAETIRSTRCGASRRGAWTSPERPGSATMADAIVSQQRFIATMQGRTATFSTFSDAQVRRGGNSRPN